MSPQTLPRLRASSRRRERAAAELRILYRVFVAMGGDIIRTSVVQLVVALTAIVCLTVLAAVGAVEGAIAVPIIAALAGARIGYASGYETASNGDRKKPPA